MTRRAPRTLAAVTLVTLVGFSAPAAGARLTGPAAGHGPSGDRAFTAEGTHQVSFMVFGDSAELAAYEGLVAAFEERHPTIDVSIVHIPGQSDYRARLGADFAAGTPSDVVLINYRRYAQFAALGLLEPLGPYLRRSELLDEGDFYREALDPFRWAGELQCIPQNVSSLVVYVNRDLFEEAGVPYPAEDWTWDDFLGAARALTEDLDGDGRPDRHGLGTEVSLIRLAPFIWQNGGELVLLENARTPLRLAVDQNAAREAIEWFVDLQVEHGVVPNALSEAAQDSESRFLAGTTAMYLNSRRGVPTYRAAAEFDWDVVPLPRRREAAGILHSDAYCMPAAARDKEAAWTFIEFANSAEGQAIIAASGRTVPSLRAVAESDAFLDPSAGPAHSEVFLETIPDLRAVPVHPGWVDVEELAGEELERAFYGNASVDEAIERMIARTTPFFRGAEG